MYGLWDRGSPVPAAALFEDHFRTALVGSRIDLRIAKNGNPIVEGMTQIASGYGHACNAAAVVVGPTGLAYDVAKDILYVESTSDNVIFAVPHARKTGVDEGTGSLVYQDNVHLHGPLGLLLAPSGDLITANGDAVNPCSSVHS